MPHRNSASKRYASRLVFLTLVGWALFSRGRNDEFEVEQRDAERVFDFDEHSVSWEGFGHGSETAPDLELRAQSAPEAEIEGPVIRPKRRLATTLVFVTLFFGGAALSAGAGDVIGQAVDSGANAEDVTSTDETGMTETTPVDDQEPAGEESLPEEEPSEPSEVEPAPDPGVGGGDTGAEDPGEDQRGSEPPADDGSTEEDAEGPGDDQGQPGTDEEPSGDDSSAPGDDEGQPGDEGGRPGDDEGQAGDGDGQASEGDSESGNPGTEPGKDDDADDRSPSPAEHANAPSVPAGPPLLEVPETPVTEAAPLDPEADVLGTAATIWLHRILPDPTPPARRLSPAFAKMLVREARRANTDWSLVLGVIRARGQNGRQPAGRGEVRALAVKLHRLVRSSDEWSAVLALYGRTAMADRAVALARYDRAVGIRALVIGLTAAKPALRRAVLADSRINIYPAGRSDVASGKIDVRVLVVLRYLAEAHGQATVSSLHSGHRLYARPGVVSAHVYGLAVDIAAVGGTSIAGNQQPGGVTEHAVRNILLLPAELQPRQVISLLGMGGPSLALGDHADHIHIGF